MTHHNTGNTHAKKESPKSKTVFFRVTEREHKALQMTFGDVNSGCRDHCLEEAGVN